MTLLRFIKKALKTPTQTKSNKLSFPNPTEAAQFFDEAITHATHPFHHSVFWGDRLLTLDKSAGFLSDPIFRKAYDSIRGSHQYDQYTSPQTIAWRLHTLAWAAQSGSTLEGDFVECGTFKGDMAWLITQTVDLNAVKKKFYLYDTFDGFAEKYSSDEDFPANPGFINYANQFYRDPSLYPYVRDRFAPQTNVADIRSLNYLPGKV